MSPDELVYLSAAEQGKLIRTHELSPVGLVRAYLDRIERYDGILRSYITVCADQALEHARQAEKDIGAGRYRGPLHGIPYGVKDQICTKGIRTTLGSKIRAGYLPDHDATVIERLGAAGAILIGKHNLDEWGKGSTVDFMFGRPRNPWNLEHTPSTSSSGSGIASAAGLCSGAIGEDTGGSIRGPAGANGVVGLRPTFGRVSRFGGVMYGWNADTIGPLTRTVEDCALFLAAIAGHDNKDPLTSTRRVPNYTTHLNGDIKGLRFAIVREMTWNEGVHPDVRKGMEEAFEVLRSLGAIIEEISLPLARYAVPLQMLTVDADVASMFPRLLKTRWHDFERGLRARLMTALLTPAAVYSRAMRGRALVRGQILAAFERYDALLSPTNFNPAPRLDDPRETVDQGRDYLEREYFRRITNYPYNVANVPAIAIPAGFSRDGIPISLQIAVRPFAEETVFRIAHAYECATSWHRKHPDLDRVFLEFQRKSQPRSA